MCFRLEKMYFRFFEDSILAFVRLAKACMMQGKVLIIFFESPWKFSILILFILLVQSLLSEFYLL